MRLASLPRTTPIFAARSHFHSGFCPNSLQKVSLQKSSGLEFVNKLLERKWGLSSPETRVDEVVISGSGESKGDSCYRNKQGWTVEQKHEGPSFFVVRDDLMHPLVNGNKARKLDGLLPLLQDYSVTDVVTCGGCQSAHAAAVAVLCTERGVKSHLLLRGEQPVVLTGYNLISTLYGDVTYIARSLYAKREDMLSSHANSIAGSNGCVEWLNGYLEGSCTNYAPVEHLLQSDALPNTEKSKKVVIINEGAGDAISLLGMIRLVQLLSQKHLFGKDQAVKLVVDAGTGTTAIGLALGIWCLGLPWKVFAVMLADTVDNYRKKEESLITEFLTSCNASSFGLSLNEENNGLVHWVERSTPRKFGNVMKGEVEECKKIAQQTGILVDPVYTLAAWELATRLGKEQEADGKVVMLHTGGTLGMFGLAQRYKSYFQNL